MTKLRGALGITALILATTLALSSCSAVQPPMQEPRPVETAAATAAPTTTSEPEPATGTRANPIPVDTLTEYDPASGWNFSVGVTNPDASGLVLAENQFNEPPAQGNAFIMATFYVRAKETAREDGADPAFSLTIEYVSAKGNTYSSFNASCGVIPGPGIFDVGNMYPGAEAIFNECVSVPQADVAGGTWRVASYVNPTVSIFLQGVP